MNRHHLVHDVRREYESVVDELQSVDELKSLELAKEVVMWPRERSLCYPIFTSMAVCPPSDGEDDNSQSPLFANTCTISPPPVQSLSPASHQSPVSSLRCITDEHLGDECMKEDVCSPLMSELPTDREGLLQLKSQLSMELLWIKQAITSRQQVS